MGLVDNLHVFLDGKGSFDYAICAYLRARLVTLDLLGPVVDAVVR